MPQPTSIVTSSTKPTSSRGLDQGDKGAGKGDDDDDDVVVGKYSIIFLIIVTSFGMNNRKVMGNNMGVSDWYKMLNRITKIVEQGDAVARALVSTQCEQGLSLTRGVIFHVVSRLALRVIVRAQGSPVRFLPSTKTSTFQFTLQFDLETVDKEHLLAMYHRKFLVIYSFIC